ncbi:amino acid/amide ABC transporter substrate-binding protein (HAAT family) [Paraburkholderia sp. BL23I1N1]|uniref:branched-chain amino acid ABC transporter substrate-binding protein n=1 Tax=Paraburkholderia sp. BL23I1N1 TaxID=1938802 RepID=UPI000E742777|nr:branched-chain amino acid ABC transporter substrate-binding protein [Paraburkholderia sp. BL23I1N1]RKE36021.1 amino acid/amide ABC transporter substrate-binding protein (HAAT family) [Paraburkholderia sp. BL23I1N1]
MNSCIFVWRSSVALSALSLLGATACNAQEIIVKVGVAAPMTGGNAVYGKDIEAGVKMAVAEENSHKPVIGGVPVRFEVESQDDQADPRLGVQVAQQLVDDGAVFVVGHFNSGTTLPASQIYAKAGIPMLTPSATNPTITQAGLSTVYRVIATDAQNAGAAGAYAVKVSNAKRIAVLDDRTAFGQGEADEFVKAVTASGGTVIDREFTNDKAVDFSSQLTHIKSLNADLIFCGVLDAQAAMLVKRMKQLGMKAQFVGGGGVMDADFIKLAGTAAEGAMAWEYGHPIDTLAQGKAFQTNFKRMYGVDMLSYAPFAYDAATLAIKAMQKADSVKPSVFNTSIKSTDFQGVTGEIQFEKNGDLKNASSTLYRVKGDAWVPVTSRPGA